MHFYRQSLCNCCCFRLDHPYPNKSSSNQLELIFLSISCLKHKIMSISDFRCVGFNCFYVTQISATIQR